MTKQHSDQASLRRVRRVHFRRRDVERAMKSAKAEGLDISAVEVTTRDGTVIRVLGRDATTAAPNPWDTVSTDAKRPA